MCLVPFCLNRKKISYPQSWQTGCIRGSVVCSGPITWQWRLSPWHSGAHAGIYPDYRQDYWVDGCFIIIDVIYSNHEWNGSNGERVWSTVRAPQYSTGRRAKIQQVWSESPPGGWPWPAQSSSQLPEICSGFKALELPEPAPLVSGWLLAGTHLDEAGEKSGFLDPICYMVQLQEGKQLAQAGSKAHGIKCVRKGICKVKG